MLDSKKSALIVDDEEDLCLLMQMTLRKMNINTAVAYNLAQAKQLLTSQSFNFCLTDLNLPDGSGLNLVEYINEAHPNMPVAVITAHGSVDLAIQALKIGAFDFVNKPLELPRLRQLIENALKVEPTIEEKEITLKKDDISTQTLLGKSPVMDKLRVTIKKLARSQAPVFLQGESGTGKEVVASLIHKLGPRSEGAFVPVNCGAIPSELMESEFFGHKKGSFTGAVSDKKGLFQMADKGTLFLDEVADLPLNMQVKLLRAIQEKKIRPIGAQEEISVDIRLLSATHKNLAELVQYGKFRQDLYYRINVIELNLPSLNERGDDVVLLSDHFIEQISRDWDTTIPDLSMDARQALREHQYQGNVRELRNILERALTLCDGDQILPEHLQLEMTNTTLMKSISDDITNPLMCDIGFPELTIPVQESAQSVHVSNNPTEPHLRSLLPHNNMLQPSEADLHNMSNTHSTNIASNVPSLLAEQSLTMSSQSMTIDSLPVGGLEAYLEQEEKRLMLEALEMCKWNRTRAAEKLGMSFRSFRYKLKKFALSDD